MTSGGPDSGPLVLFPPAGRMGDGGDRGLVAPPVFKTGWPATSGWWVRFPSASASSRVYDMRLTWTDIATTRADMANETTVELTGFPSTPHPTGAAGYFLLLAEASCCAGHVPRHPGAAVEVFAATALPMRAGRLRLSGSWRVRADGDGDGWRISRQPSPSLTKRM